MPEPQEATNVCVGCGTANPVASETCAGCGHRFAGPAGGVVPESITEMANRLAASESCDPPRKSTRADLSILGCLGRMIMVSLMAVTVIVSFGIAFFVTCSAFWPNNAALLLGLVAGLATAIGMIGLFVWARSLSR